LVCAAFRRGEFDYVDAAGEISETDFFRARSRASRFWKNWRPPTRLR